MLTGVLVIAFPVSIFSDLWSKELKDEDSDCEDNENDGINETQRQASSENIGRPQSSVRFRNDYQTLPPDEEDFRSKLSRQIVLEREDLNDIVSSIRDINEKQRRIQRILTKYAIDEES